MCVYIETDRQADTEKETERDGSWGHCPGLCAHTGLLRTWTQDFSVAFIVYKNH